MFKGPWSLWDTQEAQREVVEPDRFHVEIDRAGAPHPTACRHVTGPDHVDDHQDIRERRDRADALDVSFERLDLSPEHVDASQAARLTQSVGVEDGVVGRPEVDPHVGVVGPESQWRVSGEPVETSVWGEMMSDMNDRKAELV